jgi:hypothetical protein
MTYPFFFEALPEGRPFYFEAIIEGRMVRDVGTGQSVLLLEAVTRYTSRGLRTEEALRQRSRVQSYDNYEWCCREADNVRFTMAMPRVVWYTNNLERRPSTHILSMQGQFPTLDRNFPESQIDPSSPKRRRTEE